MFDAPRTRVHKLIAHTCIHTHMHTRTLGCMLAAICAFNCQRDQHASECIVPRACVRVYAYAHVNACACDYVYVYMNVYACVCRYMYVCVLMVRATILKETLAFKPRS